MKCDYCKKEIVDEHRINDCTEIRVGKPETFNEVWRLGFLCDKCEDKIDKDVERIAKKYKGFHDRVYRS